MKNIGCAGLAGKPTAGEMAEYLRIYSSMNDRIRKAQFHASISCKGHGRRRRRNCWTSHTSTSIVTSCIAPDGRKIGDRHERARSRKAIGKILGVDRKGKLDKALEDAKGYSFSSFAQFKAVMEALGYEAYMKRETVFVKRDGAVQRKMPLSAVEALYEDTVPDKARQRQLRGILLKYRDVCVDRKELKDKFGIDLVFFGRRDESYGYMIVDHANKAVIHGAGVLAAGELLDFATPEQRFDRIGEFLDRMLGLDPAATAKEVNAKLRRFGAYVDLKGAVRPLQGHVAPVEGRHGVHPREERARRAGEGVPPSREFGITFRTN